MVTTDELKDLAYLPGEISRIDRELKEIDRPPVWFTDLSRTQKAECAAALIELKGLLLERRQMCAEELERLRAFVDSIEDPFTRELFRLRYARALEWEQVNRIITERGFWYEDDSLRLICKRYLERYNRNESDQNNKKGTAAAV